LTVSKQSAIRRKTRRKCPQKARHIQLVRVLEGHWGLSVKQIARRMKVCVSSVRKYLLPLIQNKTVVINFKHRDVTFGRPVHYYALKRKK
jgi:predicted ArsR family transcriptional regulator